MNRNVLIAVIAALSLAPTTAFAAEKAEKAPPPVKAEKAAPAPKAEPAPSAAKPGAVPPKDASKPAPSTAKPAAASPTETARPAAAGEKMASADKPRRGPSRANEDARECLGQPTNREVAICAEKFR